MTTAKRLFLIDGYGFVFRAYHSLPPLTRGDGTPVGAVYGFSNMLLKQLTELKADYLAVVFDAGQKTFRHDIYAEYKANRPPAPEDLIVQFPLIRECVEAFDIPAIEKVGFEADDVIATLAKQASNEGYDVVVVSSDKDLTQLIDEHISLYDPLKSKWIKAEDVREKYGVNPDKMRDLLSLSGDSSDNIPGVPGIGPKTAAELLSLYGNLEGIYQNLDQIKQPKRQQTLRDNHENALLSQKLVTLDFHVDLGIEIAALKAKPFDIARLDAFLATQGFKSLAQRLQKSKGGETSISVGTQPISKHIEVAAPSITIINSMDQWQQCCAGFIEKGSIGISLHLANDAVVGLAIADTASHVVYIAITPTAADLSSTQLNWLDAGDSVPKQTTAFSITLQQLARILAHESILKIVHDAKKWMHVVGQSVPLTPVHDLELLSYISSAGLFGHTLNDMIERFTPQQVAATLDTSTTNIVDSAEILACGNRAVALLHIYPLLREQVLINQQWRLFSRIEMPLSAVLYDMEATGICVDPKQLHTLSAELATKIAALERTIFQQAGTEFNIGSPKQLGEVLFDRLNLPHSSKKGKSGTYPTHVEILEDLAAQGHEITEHILNWRHLSKLRSTYAEALIKTIRGHNNRIHTVFAMATTSTGRLSSHDPNLQNIPIRTEEGQKIRAAFVAKPGCVLLSADYSQIELRLLADMANIETLQVALREGKDIHALTASQVFGIPVDEVSADLRRHAKAINFGIIYGLSAFGLAKQLRIDRTTAAEYIKTYFQRYPGIAEYIEHTRSFAQKNGYVKTLFGRRCYLKDINSSNPTLRNFSERAAINAPLQGTAADIIKKAMVKLHTELNLQGLQSHMVLQVHDELLLETPESEIPQATSLLKATMENIVSLSVPLTVDVGIGHNWRDIQY